MAIGNLWKLDKVVMPAGVEFSMIKNQRWVAGITSLLEHPAGHPWPMFRANQSQKPMLEFTTHQLDLVMTNFAVSGASVGSTSTYFKQAAVTGSAARASTVHQKITLAQTCGYWTTIRLPHNGAAEANMVLVSAYDGVNDPFVYAGGQALSGTFANGNFNFYGAGPVEINGTLIPGTQEITIDSGLRLIQAGDASEEFDTFVGIELGNPTVTVRFLNAINWATIGLRGTVLDGVNGLKCFARKFAANGSRVSNVTAQHISFTGLLGTATPVDSNGQATSPTSDTVKIELIASTDALLPLTSAVGVAIT